jgi:outer membrane protein TolC
MNAICLYIFGLWIFILPVKSQTNKTLESYIKQGLEHNLALQQKQLNLEKSIQALKEANGLFYPSAELNAQYTLSNGGRSINLPLGDLMNPVYTSLNQILQNMGQEGGFPQINNQKVQFLPNDYHDTKIRFVLPLVNAEIYYNRKVKKEMISYAQAEANVYKREVVKEIKTAYLRYLQAVKVVEAYNSAEKLVTEALRVNEKLVKNQMAGNDKLLRIKAELSQVEAQLTKADNDRKTASSYFNFLINQSLPTIITIDSTLLNNLVHIEPIITIPQSREELTQLKSAGDAAQQYVNMKQAYWAPTISNITDVGYQGYQYKFNSDQRYVMNVIDLRWNIFNGFQNRRRISQAKIDKNMLDKKFAETEQQIELQQQLAQDNLLSSLKAEKANQSSLASSVEYYKTVSRQYAEGQKSLLDILDARNQLTSSNINYLVSHFETLIKQAEWERAMASYEFK